MEQPPCCTSGTLKHSCWSVSDSEPNIRMSNTKDAFKDDSILNSVDCDGLTDVEFVKKGRTETSD